MTEEKKLNNLDPGSKEGITKDKTEGDKKDEGGEKLIAGKFKSNEELLAAYKELEADHTRKSQEASDFKERLAKLEGVIEERGRETRKPPEITAEEKKAMTERFKEDFNLDPLPALHNFVSPYVREAREAREEVESLRQELLQKEERRQAAFRLADEARKEDPEGFDELKPLIEKELRENETWTKFENPYTAAFYHVKGKSLRKLPTASDAERESYVEGRSEELPTEGLKDFKKKMVKKIRSTKGNVSHLPQR
jgi:hypothetical protein